MLGVEGSGHWVTPAREKGAVDEWSRMGSEREGASPGEPEWQAQCSAIHSHKVEVSHVSIRLIPLTHTTFISAISCSIPIAQSLWDTGNLLCAAAQGKWSLCLILAPRLDWIFLSVWVGLVFLLFLFAWGLV